MWFSADGLYGNKRAVQGSFDILLQKGWDAHNVSCRPAGGVVMIPHQTDITISVMHIHVQMHIA